MNNKVFVAYNRKLLRELENIRSLLEKEDIKGAMELLDEVIGEAYADMEIS